LKQGKQTKQTHSKAKSKKNNIVWIALVAVLLLGGVAWYSLRATDDDSVAPQKPGVMATLSPALFTGKTRQAYQAAREIPEVLDEMPCFCGCMRNVGHQSNLHCFKDDHSSHCVMCQDIALDSQRMHNEGKTIEQIRDSIVAKYASSAP
jgi:hypothetical protein